MSVETPEFYSTPHVAEGEYICTFPTGLNTTCGARTEDELSEYCKIHSDMILQGKVLAKPMSLEDLQQMNNEELEKAKATPEKAPKKVERKHTPKKRSSSKDKLKSEIKSTSEALDIDTIAIPPTAEGAMDAPKITASDPFRKVEDLRIAARKIDEDLVEIIEPLLTTMEWCSGMNSASIIKEYRLASSEAISLIQKRKAELGSKDKAEEFIEILQQRDDDTESLLSTLMKEDDDE